LLLISTNSISQLDTLFWFVAPDVLQSHADRPILFRFATLDKASLITVSQPANPSFPTQTINLAANSSNSLDLTPWINMVENKPSDTKLNYGFKIKASEPITTYYEVNTVFNPEIFALKGTNALGFRFIVPVQNFMNNRAGATSGFNIVATEDNTSITITPTKNIKGHLANVPFTINLNKGETYFAEAASLAAADHLSGSIIQSNKKIAVTVHDDSVIGTPLGGGCQDLMGDQLIPNNMLGKEYIAIKGYLRNPDRVCLFALNDNTSISIDGAKVSTLNKGEFYTHLLSNPTAYIAASDSISVLHVSGFGCEAGQAILPQIHCTGSFAVPFVRSTNDFIALNILVPAGAEDGFTINGLSGKINASSFSLVPGTNNRWMFAKIDISGFFPLTQKVFKVENSKNKFQLGIIHGTSSSGCRYGFFSGFSTLKYKVEAIKNDLCESDTIRLFSNVFDNATYNWKGPDSYSNTGQSILFPAVKNKNSGWYKLSGYTENTCNIIPDSIYITINKNDSLILNEKKTICSSQIPYKWRNQTILNEGKIRVVVPNIIDCIDSIFYLDLKVNKFSAGIDREICKGDSIKLVGNGGVSYSWDKGIVDNLFFKPNISNRYHLTATDENGCKDTSSVFIKVNQLPYVFVTKDTSVCEGNFPFELNAIGVGNFYWKNDKNRSGNNSLVQITDQGIYYVRLTDIHGCTDSTQFNVSILPLPNVVINNKTGVIQVDCKNQKIDLQAFGGVKYVWFDGVKELNNTDEISVIDSGNYHVYVTDNNNCKSSSSITIKKDISKPKVSISNNTGGNQIDCINQSISLTATGGSIYVWSDGYKNIGYNDHIIISDSGTYEVIVTSNLNGCSQISKISLTKDITKPKVIIQNPTLVTQIDCNNPFVNLTATGGSNFVWSDGAKNIGFNDQITISDSGTFEVMVSSLTTGCTEKSKVTITKDITKPNVTITNNTGVLQIDCINPLISLTAKGGDKYEWTDGVMNLSNLDNISISNPGLYEVLVTSYSTGCKEKSSIKITKDTTKPNVTIINNTGVTQIDCINPSITLTANGGISYVWSLGSTLIDNTSQIKISDAGVYEVLVTSSITGCKEKSSIIITKDLSKPIVDIINNTGVNQIDCNNPVINLTATGGVSFLWSDGINVIGNLNNVNISEAGTFYVQVIGTNGCQNSDSIILTKKPVNPPVPKILITSGTDVFCEGQSVTLKAFSHEVGDFEWRKGASVLSKNSEITVIESGIYEVSVKIAGCKSNFNDTIIQVYKSPLKPILTSTPEFCFSQKANLDSLTKKVNGIGIKWYDSSNNLINNNYLLKDGETYFAESNSLDGCSSLIKENIKVKIKSNPYVPFANSEQEFCSIDNKKVSDLLPSSSSSLIIEWISSGIKKELNEPLINDFYYAYAILDGCVSEKKTEVKVKIIEPQKPNLYTEILCANNNVIPMLSNLYPNFSNYFYYKKSDLTDPPVLLNSKLVNGEKYYVRSTLNGCLSEPTLITISLNNGPKISDLAYNLLPALCLKNKPTIDLVESTYSILPSLNSLFWYTSKDDKLENSLSKNSNVVTGAYWIALKDNYGCFSKKQQVNITVDPGFLPNLKPLEFCSLNDYKVSNLNVSNITNQQGTILWYESKESQSPLSQNDNINRNKDYWASFILENSSCEHQDRIKLPISWIYFNDKIELSENKQFFCKTKQNFISDINLKPYLNNQINLFIDENSSTALSPMESLYEIPYYAALTKYTSDGNLCISSSRAKIDVHFYSPKVYPVIKGTVCGKNNGKIEFKNVSNDCSVFWYDMKDSLVLDYKGLVYPKLLDNQSFKVIFKDSKGCNDSLKFSMPNCFVDSKPQIVTPDNDGENDTWKIGYYLKYEKVQVKIYNRWGNEVYSSSIPYMDDWNGFYKNDFLPTGTYYYVIDKGNEEDLEYGFIEFMK